MPKPKAKPRRKSIAKSVRFEVFKRDSFTCQYCGHSAPDVILEIDHINPVANGGDNEIINLLTSCRDCNSGKGAKKLSDKSAIEKQKQQLKELNERRQQLEMMLKWRDELSKINDTAIEYFENKFHQSVQHGLTEYGKKKVRTWIKQFGITEVLDCLEISVSQYFDNDNKETIDKVFSYIPRICANRKKFAEKPFLKDIHYIYGILRNRMRYCNRNRTIDALVAAHEVGGASIDELKQLAITVKSWHQFTEALEENFGVSL